MSEFRHEYKYVCTLADLADVENSISVLMDIDKNARKTGEYTVRSLYFDDYNDSCYYDNLYGYEPREKFRIRIYNQDSSRINLELKKKQKGKVKKESCSLPYDVCRQILERRSIDIRAVDAPLFRKFYLQYCAKGLQPKVIVEYDRIPYVYKDGNVRVTFDKNIRSSNQCRYFLEDNVFFRPITETNTHLLEVKFDEYLPDFIHRVLNDKKLKQSTFSKYFLCRKYGLGGCNNEF